MGEAVVRVARRINATAEEGRDTLDLSDCKLISFPDGVFKVLRTCTDNIREITLADNEIKALPNKFFTTFVQLRELNLQGNRLTKLPDAVGDMEHLISINLSRNCLSVFPQRLTGVRTLQHIRLENNQITGGAGEPEALRKAVRFPAVLNGVIRAVVHAPFGPSHLWLEIHKTKARRVIGQHRYRRFTIHKCAHKQTHTQAGGCVSVHYAAACVPDRLTQSDQGPVSHVVRGELMSTPVVSSFCHCFSSASFCLRVFTYSFCPGSCLSCRATPGRPL
uniref:Leucine rich repeat containing 20 n=1 Tax=Electrophorus electricus TaxID=8005 RepID=A0AAY5ERF1_ELEEL